jgi:IS1 family transposase
MTDEKTAKDVIGRPIKQGDYVFYYQNIYEVRDVLNNKSSKTLNSTKHYRVKLFLADPSRSTKVITRQSTETCLLPEKDITLWLLGKGK